MRGLAITLAAMLALGGGLAAANPLESNDEAAQREHWQRTFAQAREDLGAAKKRPNEARITYQNMRHRKRARGVEKQKIIDALETSEAELVRAQTAVEAAHIAARRAGVPPGWFRDKSQRTPPASRTGY